jgi:hypothetical protein
MICPCNVFYDMQMKEKICLTGLLLGTNHGCIATNQNQSVLQCNENIPVHFQPKCFRLRVCHQQEKVMLTVFWNSQGVMITHFQKRGQNMISASLREVLLKLREATDRKLPDQLARGLLLHHGNARPHTDRVIQGRIQELH